MVEHVVQVVQVFVLGVPEEDALGLLGYVLQFNGTEEWLHLGFNTLYLLSLYALILPLLAHHPSSPSQTGFLALCREIYRTSAPLPAITPRCPPALLGLTHVQSEATYRRLRRLPPGHDPGEKASAKSGWLRGNTDAAAKVPLVWISGTLREPSPRCRYAREMRAS